MVKPPNEVIADCQAAAMICTTGGSQLEADMREAIKLLESYPSSVAPKTRWLNDVQRFLDRMPDLRV